MAGPQILWDPFSGFLGSPVPPSPTGPGEGGTCSPGMEPIGGICTPTGGGGTTVQDCLNQVPGLKPSDLGPGSVFEVQTSQGTLYTGYVTTGYKCWQPANVNANLGQDFAYLETFNSYAEAIPKYGCLHL